MTSLHQNLANEIKTTLTSIPASLSPPYRGNDVNHRSLDSEYIVIDQDSKIPAGVTIDKWLRRYDAGKRSSIATGSVGKYLVSKEYDHDFSFYDKLFSNPQVSAENNGFEALRKSNLCEYCQHIFIDWTRMLNSKQETMFEPVIYHHHGSLSKLQQSIKTYGCRICWLFSQHLVDHGKELPVHQQQNQEEIAFVKLTRSSWPFPDWEPSNFRYEWGLEYLQPGAILDELPLIKIGTDPSSPSDIDEDDSEKATFQCSSDYTQSLALVKKWLDRCIRTGQHRDCILPTLRPIPHRLLYLGSSEINLRIFTSRNGNLSYATLSHCWGNLKSAQLLRSTLQAYQVAIPQESLCKTFQDAIYVAKFCGFEYLWIDSLCIVQDDDIDWRLESALMSSIYGNADLNIAASGAVDGSQGLFFERPMCRLRRYRTSTVLHGHRKMYDFSDGCAYSRCTSSQPLSTRAWAVQERILSTRTVHFSKTELFWECKGNHSCEIYPEAFPWDPTAGTSFLYKGNPDWLTVVQLYTAANLTYGRDKLIAISGLARHFYDRVYGYNNYAAGLWRSDSDFDTAMLYWKVLDVRPKPSTYRAPSWSWAAIDGKVVFPHRDNHLHCSISNTCVLDVSVTTSPEDRFGEVSAGVLRLGCKVLLPCEIDIIDRVMGTYSIRFNQQCMCIDINLDCEGPFPTSKCMYYFVPIYIKFRNKISGLVLQSTQFERGQYRRVCSADILYDSGCVPGDALLGRLQAEAEKEGSLDNAACAELMCAKDGRVYAQWKEGDEHFIAWGPEVEGDDEKFSDQQDDSGLMPDGWNGSERDENESYNQDVSVEKASPGQEQFEQDEAPRSCSYGSEQLGGEVIDEDCNEYSHEILEEVQRRLYVITII